jgi:hypothetical protein
MTKFQGNATAETAVKDLLQAPQEADNQADMRKRLREALQADAGFHAELERLLSNAQHQSRDTISNMGPGAVATHGGVAAGAGGVAVGGNVQGNITTGRAEHRE